MRRPMHLILGGTGHVGSAVAENLLQKTKDVIVATHDPKKRNDWDKKGAMVAVVDVMKIESMKKVFSRANRLFLLNPPADPATNTVQREQESLDAILSAVEESRFEKIVAESTYGAQPGDGIGDLGVLFQMETELRNLFIPSTIIRAAYYMTNWDSLLTSVQETGILPTLYPADFKIPMVSPRDIGKLAAEMMLDNSENFKIEYIEGPQEYSASDVAAAMSEVFSRSVKVLTIPPEDWISFLEKQGFANSSARSMAAMTDIVLRGSYEKPRLPHRGTTTLRQHIQQAATGLIASSRSAPERSL